MEKDKLAFGEENISGHMVRIVDSFNSYLDRQYYPYGLVGFQHAFLTVICRNPGIPQRQMLNWFCMDQSNIARNLSVLEKRGYIRRERMDTDKRNQLLYPTERALEIYANVVAIYDNALNQLLAGLSSDDLGRFKRMLNMMETNVKALNDPAL